jgi:hypothetical protein
MDRLETFIKNHFKELALVGAFSASSIYAILAVKSDYEKKRIKHIKDLKKGDRNVCIEGNITPIEASSKQKHIYYKSIKTVYESELDKEVTGSI